MTGRVSKRRTSTRIRPGGAATLVLAVPARESSCSQASPPRSTNYSPGLWVASMPEQADRVIGQLAKQVVEAPSRAEQRVALPPAGVAVVVQGPESFGGDVAKPRDRQPRPFGAEVIAPRRAKLDDVDRLTFLLELDAHLVSSPWRRSHVAQLSNPRDVAFAQHEAIVRSRPDRSSVNPGRPFC